MSSIITTIAVIYTASYCPYCTSAKQLLQQKNIEYTEIDVTDKSTRDDMIERSGGRKTVPQIFIAGTHIGGFDDLQAASQAGKLDELIKQHVKTE